MLFNTVLAWRVTVYCIAWCRFSSLKCYNSLSFWMTTLLIAGWSLRHSIYKLHMYLEWWLYFTMTAYILTYFIFAKTWKMCRMLVHKLQGNGEKTSFSISLHVCNTREHAIILQILTAYQVILSYICTCITNNKSITKKLYNHDNGLSVTIFMWNSKYGNFFSSLKEL